MVEIKNRSTKERDNTCLRIIVTTLQKNVAFGQPIKEDNCSVKPEEDRWMDLWMDGLISSE